MKTLRSNTFARMLVSSLIFTATAAMAGEYRECADCAKVSGDNHEGLHALHTDRMEGWEDWNGWYVGAGVGTSEYKHESPVDNTDTVGRLYAGYQLNPYWGIEGGWVDLGTFSTTEHEFDINGTNVAGVGSYPLGKNLAILGKAGIYRWDANGFGNSTEGMWGVGVKYKFNNGLAVRAEAERYNDVRNEEIDTYNIGAQYSFAQSWRNK